MSRRRRRKSVPVSPWGRSRDERATKRNESLVGGVLLNLCWRRQRREPRKADDAKAQIRQRNALICNGLQTVARIAEAAREMLAIEPGSLWEKKRKPLLTGVWDGHLREQTREQCETHQSK